MLHSALDVEFDKLALVRRADLVLTHATSCFYSTRKLFDRRYPLPVPSRIHRSERRKVFRELLRLTPSPYDDAVLRSFQQMMGLACGFMPFIWDTVAEQPLFEWLMHHDIFKPDYRDHMAHQVQVAAIGDLLLMESGESVMSAVTDAYRQHQQFGDELNSLVSYDDQEKFIRLAWWLAAMFHDCGYPFQYHYDHCRRLGKACNVEIGDPTTGTWNSAHSYLARVAGGLSSADVTLGMNGRHPFYSAAELAAASQKYGEWAHREDSDIRKRRNLMLKMIAPAIIRHHRPRTADMPYKQADPKVGFFENPLGYLLILSDELHEVERPRVRFLRRRGRVVAIPDDGRISRVGIRIQTNGNAHITYVCRRPYSDAWKGSYETYKKHELESGLKIENDNLMTSLYVDVPR